MLIDSVSPFTVEVSVRLKRWHSLFFKRDKDSSALFEHRLWSFSLGLAYFDAYGGYIFALWVWVDCGTKVWILKRVISERWTFDQLNSFSTYLPSKLDSPSPMFWLEENLFLSNVMIRGESNFDDILLKKVFNCSEVRLSKTTCYKIHTLAAHTRSANIWASQASTYAEQH